MAGEIFGEDRPSHEPVITIPFAVYPLSQEIRLANCPQLFSVGCILLLETEEGIATWIEDNEDQEKRHRVFLFPDFGQAVECAGIAARKWAQEHSYNSFDITLNGVDSSSSQPQFFDGKRPVFGAEAIERENQRFLLERYGTPYSIARIVQVCRGIQRQSG